MFKFICLVALFAVASAQNWHPRPPVWNEPQVPLWPQPQPPIWNQPQQPQPPIIWNPPQNVPQDRPGVRDHRCPSTNDRFVTLFPHERDCSQFYMCNAGFRYTFDCPRGLFFDRHLLVCDRPQTVRC